MLTEETVIDKLEVLEDGSIQIREATYILRDGVRIGLLGYHRSAHRPGEDVSQKQQRVRDVAAVVWTEDVIQKEDEVKAEVESARRA
jgi:hypothetical protein